MIGHAASGDQRALDVARDAPDESVEPIFIGWRNEWFASVRAED